MSTHRKKSTAAAGATTTTTPAPNQLNKQASSTTGIYQQSVLLRSRLARIPDFAPFLEFSQSGPRASLDVVSQLWQTFAFGIPLCALFNLLGDSKIVDIGALAIGHLQNLSMYDRKRAVAKFIMAIGTLTDDGRSDDAFRTLSITEIVNLQDTNGFVKLVSCLLRLLDKLPEHVWSSELEQSLAEPSKPYDNTPLNEVRTPQEVERANIIRELIETERKYVQDLEVMLSYAQQLRSQDIVSSDTIHKLFPALSNLADSQRKFLITIEATFELPWEEQNWGKCFSDHEHLFSVYDTYCTNCQNAVSTAILEEPALSALAHVISPKELQAFLIKPVQRICKYPLLLSSLSKVTPSDHEHYQALLDGLAATKRITDTVNNAQRQQENEVVFEALMNRLKDWKGVPINQHAPLLLDDLFAVSSDQNGSGEYHVFLFERLMILCVPVPPDIEKRPTEKASVFKRSASSNALNLQAQASTFLAEGVVVSRKAKTQLALKGALYIRSFEDLETIQGACTLRFCNTGEQPHCVYTFHCTNSEKMNQWHSEIKRQLDRWQKDKEEQRTRKESRSHMIYGERPVYEQVSSSGDSLGFMRAAPRPKHPYESDFRSRSRSNSRVQPRSTSTSSVRDGGVSVSPDEASKQPEAKITRRGGMAAYSMPPERDHIEVLAQSGAIEALRARSQTQDGSSYIMWRNQILPPQPPPPQLPRPPTPISAIGFPSTLVRELPERRLRSRQSSTSTLASAESDSSSNRDRLPLDGRRPSVPGLSNPSLYPVPHLGSAIGREPRERNPVFSTSTLNVPAQPRMRSHSNPNGQPVHPQSHTTDHGVRSQTAQRSAANVSQYQPQVHTYDDRSGSQSHGKRSSGSSFDSVESSGVPGGRSSPLTPFSSTEGSSYGYPGISASSTRPYTYAVPPLPTGQTPAGQRVPRPPNLRLAKSSFDIHMGGVAPSSATFPNYQQMPVPPQPIGSPGVMGGSTSAPNTPTGGRLHITVHYGADHKFTLAFLTTTPFEEVVDKIRKKIRICTSSGANGHLRMYYGDDRGSRTLLRTTEDYRGALDVVGARLARGSQTLPGSLVVWVQPDV